MDPIKPKSAICTLVYSETYDDYAAESNHFVCFHVIFPEKDLGGILKEQKGILTVKTDSDHRNPITSKMELYGDGIIKKFELWQEHSWQNALFKAWTRYTSATGYEAATTRELVYELQEQEDGSFSYDLNTQSKKLASTKYSHGIMQNEDGTESHIVIVPKSEPDWFKEPRVAKDSPETPTLASAGESYKPHLKNNELSKTDSSIEQNKQSSQNGCLQSLFEHINLQLISGFMVALGAAAVAVAFTLLNAASLGTAGLVVASIGLASIITGIGFFKAGSDNNNSTKESLTVDSPDMQLNYN